jgi:hypothetical protein
MATEPENHHENAESRRQERREHDKEAYREQGDDMRQGGPDPDLAHRLRTRSGDGNFDPNVQAEDGTSDGVAAHIGSSGQGASQRGHDTEQNSNKRGGWRPEGLIGPGQYLQSPSCSARRAFLRLCFRPF